MSNKIFNKLISGVASSFLLFNLTQSVNAMELGALEKNASRLDSSTKKNECRSKKLRRTKAFEFDNLDQKYYTQLSKENNIEPSKESQRFLSIIGFTQEPQKSQNSLNKDIVSDFKGILYYLLNIWEKHLTYRPYIKCKLVENYNEISNFILDCKKIETRIDYIERKGIRINSDRFKVQILDGHEVISESYSISETMNKSIEYIKILLLELKNHILSKDYSKIYNELDIEKLKIIEENLVPSRKLLSASIDNTEFENLEQKNCTPSSREKNIEHPQTFNMNTNTNNNISNFRRVFCSLSNTWEQYLICYLCQKNKYGYNTVFFPEYNEIEESIIIYRDIEEYLDEIERKGLSINDDKIKIKIMAKVNNQYKVVDKLYSISEITNESRKYIKILLTELKNKLSCEDYLELYNELDIKKLKITEENNPI